VRNLYKQNQMLYSKSAYDLPYMDTLPTIVHLMRSKLFFFYILFELVDEQD
jgi:hypothetical protein